MQYLWGSCGEISVDLNKYKGQSKLICNSTLNVHVVSDLFVDSVASQDTKHLCAPRDPSSVASS